jgi:dihydroorotase
MSILIKNGYLVLPDRIKKADIFIEGSRISKIGELNIDADRVIDASGKSVMAGFVDMHCHLRDPGYEYKEDIESGTAAAIRGGFTSIACMPNTNPVIDNAALVKYVISRANECGMAKVYPIGSITKGMNGLELSEMGKMKEAGAVAVSDDGRPVENAQVMRTALEYAFSHRLPVISHCEDLKLSQGGVVNEGFHSTVSGLNGIPRAAEETVVARDILLAENFGVGVHIAHVSTAGSVELVRQAKRRGVKVTAETCPHYFSATDEEIISYNTSAKINPPLREESDVAAIIAGLKDGTIDAIATDHDPHGLDEKRQEFNQVPFGTSGFETAFAISYTHLVDTGHLKLTELSRLLSRNPAKILGLDTGELIEDMTADIVIAELDASYNVDAKRFLSKGKNCLFDGWRVKGRIVCTIVDGEIKDEI